MRAQHLLLLVVIFLLALNCDAQPTVNASLVATVVPAVPVHAVVNSGSNVYVGHVVFDTGSGYVYAYNCNFVSLSCTLFTTLPNGQEDIYSGLGGSEFGTSVAVSGTLLVVGADGYNSGAGAVLIYNCSTTACTFITSIVGFSSNAQAGLSVAVDRSTVAVSVANTGQVNQVNLYQCSYTCSSPFVINNLNYNYDIALSGVILAIASSSNGYIYQCANYTDCTQISSVPGTYVGSVSISNGLVVFGDQYASNDSGAVYVFSCTTSVPILCGNPTTISNPNSTYEQFGTSVSVYGYTVVVSSPSITVNGLYYVGEVFVYTCTPNNGPASNVTCIGPSEQIVPTSPSQNLGFFQQSLDEISSVVLVGDTGGNLFAVSLENSIPTPTPTVFTGSVVSLSGSNVAVNSSETRTCRIVEDSDLDLYAGYLVTINGASVCCRYVGLLSGSTCEIQSCGVTKISSINYATSDNITCYADSVCYSQGSYDAIAEAIPVYRGTALSGGAQPLLTAGPTNKTIFTQKTNGVVTAAFQITPENNNLAAEYGCSLKGTYISTSPPASCYVTICGNPTPFNDYFYGTTGNCYTSCIGST